MVLVIVVMVLYILGIAYPMLGNSIFFVRRFPYITTKLTELETANIENADKYYTDVSHVSIGGSVYRIGDYVKTHLDGGNQIFKIQSVLYASTGKENYYLFRIRPHGILDIPTEYFGKASIADLAKIRIKRG